jgi:hypothetical protein
MTPEERELLVEQVTSAFRERSARGELRPAPAWHDLDEAGRRDAHAKAVTARALEAALDPRGWSTTTRAVLARLR